MKVILIGTAASSVLGFRTNLIKALLRQKHSVYTFVSEYTEEELIKIEGLGVIPVTYQLKRGGLNPLTDIKATYDLSKKIKEIAPDMVLSYFSKPVIFGTLASKIAKVPRVIGMLEGLGYAFTDQPEGLSKKTKLIKSVQVLLYRVALPQLDKIIFLNLDDSRDLLEKYNIEAKQVEILGGIGLDLNEFSHQPLTNIIPPIKFLFVGRLLKEKGIHDFISAAQQVKEKYPETQFTVLGAIDTTNLGALKQSELDRLISLQIVNYLGQVDNVKDWITESDVFVLPSYREGLPLSTQEAMAIGRAVITTDAPGCRDTVVDGVNGFLVEKWNPQALANKMIYLIEHPQQIATMGYEGYKIAREKFDCDKVNERLLNILEL